MDRLHRFYLDPSSGQSIVYGTGTPSNSLNLPQGSIYVRRDANTDAGMYIRVPAGWQALAGGAAGVVSGSFTAGFVPVATGTTSLGNSPLSVSGSNMTAAGTIASTGFIGNGSLLTSIPYSALTGTPTIPTAVTIDTVAGAFTLGAGLSRSSLELRVSNVPWSALNAGSIPAFSRKDIAETFASSVTATSFVGSGSSLTGVVTVIGSVSGSVVLGSNLAFTSGNVLGVTQIDYNSLANLPTVPARTRLNGNTGDFSFDTGEFGFSGLNVSLGTVPWSKIGGSVPNFARRDTTNTFTQAQTFSAGISTNTISATTYSGGVVTAIGSVSGSIILGANLAFTSGNVLGVTQIDYNSLANRPTLATQTTINGSAGAFNFGSGFGFSGLNVTVNGVPWSAISSGTVPNFARRDEANTFAGAATFSSTLTAAGTNITNIPFGNLISVPDFARRDAANTFTAAATFSGTLTAVGTNITSIPFANLNGVPNFARRDTSNTFTAAIFFDNPPTAVGTNITGIPYANLTGTPSIPAAVSIDGATGAFTIGTGLARSGQALFVNNLPWAQIGSGVPDFARRDLGNTFTVANTFSATTTFSAAITTSGSGAVTFGNTGGVAFNENVAFALGKTATFNGAATFNSTMTGNGSGLTNLELVNVNGNLSLARRDATNTFTTTNTFNGEVIAGLGSGGFRLGPGTSADHTYIAFHARSSSPSTRSAYFGVAASGSTHIDLVNEMSGGTLRFYTGGSLRATIDTAGVLSNGYARANGTPMLRHTGGYTELMSGNGTVALSIGDSGVSDPRSVHVNTAHWFGSLTFDEYMTINNTATFVRKLLDVTHSASGEPTLMRVLNGNGGGPTGFYVNIVGASGSSGTVKLYASGDSTKQFELWTGSALQLRMLPGRGPMQVHNASGRVALRADGDSDQGVWLSNNESTAFMGRSGSTEIGFWYAGGWRFRVHETQARFNFSSQTTINGSGVTASDFFLA